MIVLEGVGKRYGPAWALQNISLEVPKGTLCVLLGPSGCGKTTLLRLVNRLIEPSEGRIYLDDRNVLNLDVVELRRGIGYVIQSIGLFPHQTVLENVMTVPRLLGWTPQQRRNRALEMLELVGLDPKEYATRYPRQLSGGQAQRVGLARALCADPPVLLMDEPFGAVDPPTRLRLQEEFLKLQARLQKTVLFVTHDLEEAVKLADYICLMNAGRIEQFDPPQKLLQHPKTPFVRRFLGQNRVLLSLSRIALSQIVQPIRSEYLPALPQNASAQEALNLMLSSGDRAVYVLDPSGEVVGEVGIERLLQLQQENP